MDIHLDLDPPVVYYNYQVSIDLHFYLPYSVKII